MFRLIPYQPLYLLFLTILALGVEVRADAPLESQRQTFLAAEQALRDDNQALFNRLQKGLKDYPLFPYLRYQHLQQRLEESPVDEVRSFLDSYQDTPVASRLRKAWLHYLATERRWQDFLRFHQPTKDTAIDCWHRQALLHSGQRKAALQNIDQVWLSPTSLPEACDPLFEIFRKQGGFTRQRVWQRFALAIEAGQLQLAQYLQNLLPARDRDLTGLWFAVDRDPSKILEKNRFDPSQPYTAAILLHGLQRWSQIDSVAAAQALDILEQRYSLPEDEVAELQRKLALYVASRGHPDALARLTSLPPDKVDSAVREWRVRVGLQTGDWQITLKWLNELPPAESDDPQWQYWRARALEQTGKDKEAQKIYRRLVDKRDYHGFLAAHRLGMPVQTQGARLETSATALAALERLPGIRRARELYLLDRYWEARLEWIQATRNLSAEALKRVAQLAHQWGWHDRSIITLARTGYWDDLELRFPLPYKNQVITNARHENIDPAWVYAVMRQESIFQSDIKSGAGALGLMQIMPATGQLIAKNLQTDLTSHYQLLQADTNIRYGTHYLRLNLNRLQDHPLLATAAYNAGFNRVRQWLPVQAALDADLWVETIPYFETRKYVKRVMEYAAIYEQRLGQSTRSLEAFMRPIPPNSPG